MRTIVIVRWSRLGKKLVSKITKVTREVRKQSEQIDASLKITRQKARLCSISSVLCRDVFYTMYQTNFMAIPQYFWK